MNIIEEVLAINLPSYSYNEVVKMYNRIKAEPSNNLRSLRNINYNNRYLFDLLNDVLKWSITHDSFLSIDFLISCGANLKMVDYNGNNSLHNFITFVANSHDIDMVTNIFDILLESGTDLFSNNNVNQTVMNILLFGYKSTFRQHKANDRPIYIRNPRYKSIMNEFFSRKIKEKKFDLIVNIINQLTKDEYNEIFKILYTKSIEKINILLRQYNNLVLSLLESKNINNKVVFHRNQLGKSISDYLSHSAF